MLVEVIELSGVTNPVNLAAANWGLDANGVALGRATPGFGVIDDKTEKVFELGIFGGTIDLPDDILDGAIFFYSWYLLYQYNYFELSK